MHAKNLNTCTGLLTCNIYFSCILCASLYIKFYTYLSLYICMSFMQALVSKLPSSNINEATFRCNQKAFKELIIYYDFFIFIFSGEFYHSINSNSPSPNNKAPCSSPLSVGSQFLKCYRIKTYINHSPKNLGFIKSQKPGFIYSSVFHILTALTISPDQGSIILHHLL